MSTQGRYERRGVSTAKEEVRRAVKALGPGLYPSAFCKILPDDLTGEKAHVLLLHADGAGTKSVLAYLWWRVVGDPSVFRGIAQDAAVMNIDDMLCAGATGPFVLSSTIDRNRGRIPGEVLEATIEGFRSFAAAIAAFGVEIVIGGGETADLGDSVRTIVVNATCCARLRRAQVIDNGRIQPGDRIVGLASYGTCRYERRTNSGIGSNGLTSARHDLLAHAYAATFPETVAPETPPDLVYCGPFRLEDPVPGTDLCVGEALLSPTRTYAPVLAEALRTGFDHIHGIVHCTGGGQTKCLNFGGDVRYVKDSLFPIPPIFRLIQRTSGASWKEMYEVFNMGHRMEVYATDEGAAMIAEVAKRHGVDARVIGHVEPGRGERELFLTAPEGIVSWRRARAD